MAELIYGGLWFTPLRESLSAFVDATQRTVTGTVRLKLYKGGVSSAGVSSPYSLYNASIASFATGELYDHADAKGFIRLYGLPVLVRALMEPGKKGGIKGRGKAGAKTGTDLPPEAPGAGGRGGRNKRAE
jgi:argininosuccinate synthase